MKDQPEETYQQRLPELPPEFANLTPIQTEESDFYSDPLGWVDRNRGF